MSLSHITGKVEAVLRDVALGLLDFDDVLNHPDGENEEAAADEMRLSLDDVVENYGFTLPIDREEAIEIVKSNIREAYEI